MQATDKVICWHCQAEHPEAHHERIVYNKTPLYGPWTGWRMAGRELVSPEGDRINPGRLAGLLWAERARAGSQKQNNAPHLARPSSQHGNDLSEALDLCLCDLQGRKHGLRNISSGSTQRVFHNTREGIAPWLRDHRHVHVGTALRDLYQALLPEPTERQLKHFTQGHLESVLDRAWYLGLISYDERQLYRILGKIRDAFAHGTYSVLTFDDPMFAGRLGELPSILTKVSTPGNIFYPMPELNRGKFILAVAVLHSALYIRIGQTRRLLAALPPGHTRVIAP